MKRLLPILVAFATLTSLCTGQEQSEASSDQKAEMQLNFQETPLDAVLTLYSELTGKTVLVHPAVVQTSFTSIPGPRLNKAQVIRALEIHFEMHSLQLDAEEEPFVRISPRERKPVSPPSTGVRRITPPQELQMKTFTLKHMDPLETWSLMAEVLPSKIRGVVNSQANQIVLYETNENIEVVEALLGQLDQPPPATEK